MNEYYLESVKEPVCEKYFWSVINDYDNVHFISSVVGKYIFRTYFYVKKGKIKNIGYIKCL